MKNKKEEIKNARAFDELLDIKYGVTGTPKRDNYEEKANCWLLEMVKASNLPIL